MFSKCARIFPYWVKNPRGKKEVFSISSFLQKVTKFPDRCLIVLSMYRSSSGDRKNSNISFSIRITFKLHQFFPYEFINEELFNIIYAKRIMWEIFWWFAIHLIIFFSYENLRILGIFYQPLRDCFYHRIFHNPCVKLFDTISKSFPKLITIKFYNCYYIELKRNGLPKKFMIFYQRKFQLTSIDIDKYWSISKKK